MPPGVSLFVKLGQKHPFVTILYPDLLISMVGSSFATPGLWSQPCRTGGTRAHADRAGERTAALGEGPGEQGQVVAARLEYQRLLSSN